MEYIVNTRQPLGIYLQMNSMRSGAIKDNLQLTSAKAEVTRLREQLAKKNQDYSSMANKVSKRDTGVI